MQKSHNYTCDPVTIRTIEESDVVMVVGDGCLLAAAAGMDGLAVSHVTG